MGMGDDSLGNLLFHKLFLHKLNKEQKLCAPLENISEVIWFLCFHLLFD